MKARSEIAGPVVWLTGCIHGDEVGGIVIIQEVFNWLKNNSLKKGTIFAFPLLNPTGFEAVSRYINFTREDLNRCFPGHPKGSMGERIADKIFQTILKSKPSLVIDLHNDWIHSIPYVIVDNPSNPESKQAMETTLSLARRTGFILIKDQPNLDLEKKTLSGSMLSSQIPAMTFEVGGSYLIHEDHISKGVEAILNMLTGLEMIDPIAGQTREASRKNDFTSVLLPYVNRPFCTTSGILRFLVKPGQRVKKRERVAVVYNVFGKKIETLRASVDGIVLGHTDYALALPGMEVIAFGQID